MSDDRTALSGDWIAPVPWFVLPECGQAPTPMEDGIMTLHPRRRRYGSARRWWSGDRNAHVTAWHESSRPGHRIAAYVRLDRG